MIDEIRIRDWLAAYRHAWSTDDPEEVAALFSEDVRYFTAPYRTPLEGVQAVTDYWLGEHEGDIPWSFEYQVLAQEGDLFVVRAVTTYPQGTSEAEGPENVPQPLAGDAGRRRPRERVRRVLHARGVSGGRLTPRARSPLGRVDSPAVHSRASARGEHDGGAGDGPRSRGGARGEAAGGARRGRVLRQVRRAVPAAAARGALRRDHEGVPRDRERRRLHRRAALSAQALPGPADARLPRAHALARQRRRPDLPQARGPQPHRRAQAQPLHGRGPAGQVHGQEEAHRRDRRRPARRGPRHGRRALRPGVRDPHGRGGHREAGAQREPHAAARRHRRARHARPQDAQGGRRLRVRGLPRRLRERDLLHRLRRRSAPVPAHGARLPEGRRHGGARAVRGDDRQPARRRRGLRRRRLQRHGHLLRRSSTTRSS